MKVRPNSTSRAARAYFFLSISPPHPLRLSMEGQHDRTCMSQEQFHERLQSKEPFNQYELDALTAQTIACKEEGFWFPDGRVILVSPRICYLHGRQDTHLV